MRLFPHLKKNLITFFIEGKLVFIGLLIFPMIMAYIYGTMQNEVFEGNNSFEPIKVQFDYNKATELGNILTNVLQDNKVKNFIKVEQNKAQCKVTISDDFKAINIEKLDGTDSVVDIVKGFMGSFSESINQYGVVVKNVGKLKIDDTQKSALIKNLMGKLQQGNNEPVIKEQLLQGYRSLGAREYFTISMFSFAAIMLVTTVARWFYRDKKQGVIRRSFSTPNTRESYLIGYLVSSFIFAASVNFSFVLINKILGIAFSGSILDTFTVILLQSLLQTAVIGAIIAFIKDEKVANSIMIVAVILPCIIGGVFFNTDVIEVKIFTVLSQLSPNSLILDSYKGLSIAQGVSGIGSELIIMFLLSAILLAASVIKVNMAWEE